MAGIEDIINIYRGEPLFKGKISPYASNKVKENVGKYVTDSVNEVRNYARKFPSIIKSAKVPKETFSKFKDVFDATIFKQPKYPTDSRFFYGLIDDSNKLKVDILKTLGVNIKNLTPLAVKGLNMMASLPAATITMFLQSTPANADEANMTLEDFAMMANKEKEGIETIEIGDR
tara:strand:+ start:145 stop:666 length:522 start_codon:yes stop_codon:yes gene_type:complete